MSQTDQYMLTTKKSLIQWYRDQLAKFNRLGIGKWTENNTKVSQTLIDTTKRRIVQLGGVEALDPDWGMIRLEPSDNPSTNRVRVFREKEKVKLKLQEIINGHPSTNGTTSHTRSKSISTDGSTGGKS